MSKDQGRRVKRRLMAAIAEIPGQRESATKAAADKVSLLRKITQKAGQ